MRTNNIFDGCPYLGISRDFVDASVPVLVSAFSYICNCSLGVRVVYCVTWAEAGGWAGRPVSGAPPPPTRAPSTRAPGRAPQLVNHGQLVSTTKSTDVNRVQVTGKVQVRSGHGWLKPVSRAAKTFSFKEGQFSIAIYNLAYQSPQRQNQPAIW